jgi:hypothetical protein
MLLLLIILRLASYAFVVVTLLYAGIYAAVQGIKR